jgi:hypothetical protein
MVPIALIDWEGTYVRYPAHKCVCCGNVVIAQHYQRTDVVVSK